MDCNRDSGRRVPTVESTLMAELWGLVVLLTVTEG